MSRAETIFDRLSREFEIAWYEMVLERDADNLHAIDQLAHAYTAMERYEDGLEMDRRLVAAMPEAPIAHYNLACSLSLIGDVDEAIDSLLDAIELGYEDIEHMLDDPDLDAVREHPRFEEIIDCLEEDDEDDGEDDDDDDEGDDEDRPEEEF